MAARNVSGRARAARRIAGRCLAAGAASPVIGTENQWRAHGPRGGLLLLHADEARRS